MAARKRVLRGKDGSRRSVLHHNQLVVTTGSGHYCWTPSDALRKEPRSLHWGWYENTCWSELITDDGINSRITYFDHARIHLETGRVYGWHNGRGGQYTHEGVTLGRNIGYSRGDKRSYSSCGSVQTDLGYHNDSYCGGTRTHKSEVSDCIVEADNRAPLITKDITTQNVKIANDMENQAPGRWFEGDTSTRIRAMLTAHLRKLCVVEGPEMGCEHGRSAGAGEVLGTIAGESVWITLLHLNGVNPETRPICPFKHPHWGYKLTDVGTGKALAQRQDFALGQTSINIDAGVTSKVGKGVDYGAGQVWTLHKLFPFLGLAKNPGKLAVTATACAGEPVSQTIEIYPHLPFEIGFSTGAVNGASDFQASDLFDFSWIEKLNDYAKTLKTGMKVSLELKVTPPKGSLKVAAAYKEIEGARACGLEWTVGAGLSPLLGIGLEVGVPASRFFGGFPPLAGLVALLEEAGFQGSVIGSVSISLGFEGSMTLKASGNPVGEAGRNLPKAPAAEGAITGTLTLAFEVGLKFEVSLNLYFIELHGTITFKATSEFSASLELKKNTNSERNALLECTAALTFKPITFTITLGEGKDAGDLWKCVPFDAVKIFEGKCYPL
jgi:hypothetical protein